MVLGLRETPLTRAQRNKVVTELEKKNKISFTSIKKLLDLSGTTQFNLEDAKRTELKGNATSVVLSKPEYFGKAWGEFSETQQDMIVLQLVNEESEGQLTDWLQRNVGVDEARAEKIANVSLPEGYGSLSRKALSRILPVLQSEVITYDKAVKAAGFEHHSQLGFEYAPEEVEDWIDTQTGEIKPVFKQLPYYGKALQRHVGFGSGKPEDNEEKRYGKIANPTVHIGLNQVRKVVNALIHRYGRPTEVVIELARDLKQSREQKLETQKQQTENQKRNQRIRTAIAGILQISEERVRRDDIQKWILWEELSFDVVDRRCPYSGVQISSAMLLSEEVEIEHILPFSQTLDDSLNNKTVAMRRANRVKGNRTPWQARDDFEAQGWTYEGILQRAEQMSKKKRYRFAEDGYQHWLGENKDFLARALNDTRHLSRVAAEYLKLVCPQEGTRVIPGSMTALLRGKFGLNNILGHGEKNRNDHRHHAVDACVIGITDQGLMQKFASANASAREQQLNRLVENMPLPWKTYYEHVERAIRHIWVSHKPDHGYEGELFDATIYNATGHSQVAAKDRSVIPFFARRSQPTAIKRHMGKRTEEVPYKGLLSNSNYCIEIFRLENGEWNSKVLRTYDAYQVIRQYKSIEEGIRHLRNSAQSLCGHSLVMRLMINDYIRTEIDGELLLLQVLKINSSGSVTFIKPNETNIPARYAAKLAAQKSQREGKAFDDKALNDTFFQKALSSESLKTARARRVTISPTGELRDPGFHE
ncbi:hypothetical protein FACS1894185_4690 [Betaproteobacteria bacterium]|nr:hypothetical protein FACS1894185_4690 [Betaproteobacteria bacterium]GHU15468.1 hypothetical protein FACS189441_7180 [Betaproteobacteria bacterium]